ncbi:toll/interleukin-1 receptor domain-containing protein [Streptomyces sp. NPDC002763]|uniref:toll/interleukin-1 receptor domain-containing protein n=1 Tax=Streptomyces sp. NPDC002763 TaxID=3154427 RepID=UPI003318EBF1
MAVINESVFVSYAGPDRSWAEWAAWHLHDAGHRVELDVWDWRVGDDFVQRMNEALDKATVVVALFSRSYFGDARWTREEWAAVVGRRERLVPLVIEPLVPTDVPALLAPLIRRDLYYLEEQAAVTALLEAVAGPSAPRARPVFPGGPPQTPPSPPAGVPAHRPPLPPPTIGGGLPSPGAVQDRSRDRDRDAGPPSPGGSAASLFSTTRERTAASDLVKAPRRTGGTPRLDGK